MLSRKPNESAKTFMWLTVFEYYGKGRDKFHFSFSSSKQKKAKFPHWFRSHSNKCGCRLTSFWRGKASLGVCRAFKNICYLRLKDGLWTQDLYRTKFNLKFSILEKIFEFSCVLEVFTCHDWILPPPKEE